MQEQHATLIGEPQRQPQKYLVTMPPLSSMGLDVTCGRRQDTHTSPALRRAEETIRPPLRWVGRGGARLVEETEHLTASVLSLRLFVVHDAV